MQQREQVTQNRANEHPANDKPTARYLVSRIMKEELFKYKDVQEPELPPEIHKNIEEYKEQLKNEK